MLGLLYCRGPSLSGVYRGMADSELVSCVEYKKAQILKERKHNLAVLASLKVDYASAWDTLDRYKDKMSEALAESGIPWVLRWDQDKMTETCTRMILTCTSGPRNGERLIVGELRMVPGSITFGNFGSTLNIHETAAPECLRRALGKVLAQIIT